MKNNLLLNLEDINTVVNKVFVYAIIEHDDKVLLVQDKFQKGWKFVGNKVEGDGSIVNTMIEVVKKELNLKVEPTKIIFVGNWFNKQDSEVDLRVYYLTKTDSEKVDFNHESIAEADWFITEQLDMMKETDFLFPEHYYQALVAYLNYKKTAEISQTEDKYVVQGVDLIITK